MNRKGTTAARLVAVEATMALVTSPAARTGASSRPSPCC